MQGDKSVNTKRVLGRFWSRARPSARVRWQEGWMSNARWRAGVVTPASSRRSNRSVARLPLAGRQSRTSGCWLVAATLQISRQPGHHTHRRPGSRSSYHRRAAFRSMLRVRTTAYSMYSLSPRATTVRARARRVTRVTRCAVVRKMNVDNASPNTGRSSGARVKSLSPS